MIGAKVMDRTMKRKEDATDTIKVLKKTRVRLLSGIKIVGYPSQYPNIGNISKNLKRTLYFRDFQLSFQKYLSTEKRASSDYPPFPFILA